MYECTMHVCMHANVHQQHCSPLMYRVIKQALKASGVNCTQAHMVDVSLCALFLLKVSRQVDEQLHTPYRSSHHTILDAKSDVKKMALHMLDSNVVVEVEARNSPSFDDPVHHGMEKIKNGWLSDFINKSLTSVEVDSEVNVDSSNMDADLEYELYD